MQMRYCYGFRLGMTEVCVQRTGFNMGLVSTRHTVAALPRWEPKTVKKICIVWETEKGGWEIKSLEASKGFKGPC
jgi:hypothetical protein